MNQIPATRREMVLGTSFFFLTSNVRLVLCRGV
jgi:hypothetical protein